MAAFVHGGGEKPAFPACAEPFYHSWEYGGGALRKGEGSLAAVKDGGNGRVRPGA